MPYRAKGGVELWPHALCILAQSGSEWSASLPGRFTPWKEALKNH